MSNTVKDILHEEWMAERQDLIDFTQDIMDKEDAKRGIVRNKVRNRVKADPEMEMIPVEEGTKHDTGKPRYSLVLGDFKDAIEEVVKVGTKGAEKYSDSNWLKVEKGIERYGDALLRHFWFDDKPNLDDFGLSHAAHTAWNALARLQLMINVRTTEVSR